MSQHPALETYLAAVDQRDLATLMSVVAPDVVLILPNGKRMVGQVAFEAFHRDWFEDQDWSLTSTLVAEHREPQSATFVLDEVYLDRDAQGRPVRMTYDLGLTFVLVGERWSLVLDQNTNHP